MSGRSIRSAGVAIAARRLRHTPTVSAHNQETEACAVGEIEIKIPPRQLDGQGAVFGVTLDTHSTELSMDLDNAQLQVDGTT